MTKNGADSFHTASGHTFATVTIGDHRETLSLGGAVCRDYLARGILATQKAPTASALKDALSVLTATARTRDERAVYTRIAVLTTRFGWISAGRRGTRSRSHRTDGMWCRIRR